MSELLTAIGVVSAASVSILSVFVPSYYDRQHRKEEKADAELRRIDETTLGFLAQLSNFRHWEPRSLQKIAGDRALEHLYTDLQVAQYAWERAVWPKLGDQDRAKVETIRTRLEGVHTANDLSRRANESDVPALADQILALARAANGRP